jgi:hypothetical protein
MEKDFKTEVFIVILVDDLLSGGLDLQSWKQYTAGDNGDPTCRDLGDHTCLSKFR